MASRCLRRWYDHILRLPIRPDLHFQMLQEGWEPIPEGGLNIGSAPPIVNASLILSDCVVNLLDHICLPQDLFGQHIIDWRSAHLAQG